MFSSPQLRRSSTACSISLALSPLLPCMSQTEIEGVVERCQRGRKSRVRRIHEIYGTYTRHSETVSLCCVKYTGLLLLLFTSSFHPGAKNSSNKTLCSQTRRDDVALRHFECWWSSVRAFRQMSCTSKPKNS